MAFTKTPQEKLQTRIKNITSDELLDENGEVRLGQDVFISYDDEQVVFTRKRYYPNRVEKIVDEDFDVVVPLNHENLKYISTSNANPPRYTRPLVAFFREVTGQPINTITVGAVANVIDGDILKVTKDFYDDYSSINQEEGKQKTARVKNRIIPFLNQHFGLQVEEIGAQKDYGLLLREVINSGQINQEDLIELSSQLSEGNSSNVVIQKQVRKQVKWLIDSIEEILEEDNLTVGRAKELGNSLFGFLKGQINGPEHLMETILSKYGQATLFGVPALLNTDKYVVNPAGLSRSQFDLILITHLGDVEVVELKRPDKHILECDFSRGKFYPGKDLSIAISQSERYISTVVKDNDEEFKIKGRKIRDYLIEEVGGTMFIEAVRPRAIIIMGSHKTIYRPYDQLSATNKAKINKADYEKNGDRAFQEIKSAFKNINIMTYSELLEHARTRLEIENAGEAE